MLNIKKFKKAEQVVFKVIWNLSEFTGVSLGNNAPYVFGKMIGHKGKKVSK
jgi:hypothetical protein